VFLDQNEFRSLNEGLDGGNFPGVGILIELDQRTQSPLVVQTIPGGPADKAGVLSGDIVTAIDGKPTSGLSTVQDSQLLRGKEGTNVDLSIERKGQRRPLVFHITRAPIHVPSVLGSMVKGDVAYVRVFVFGSSTGQELAQTIQRLDAQGAKGYVLDLRNNGGGYLNAAIDVSSKFIPDGPIVSIDSRTQPLTTFDADATAIAPRPLAVLVNGFTASASEITSGAIQESGAGVLIGTRTFGKGVVQTIYPLPDGSAIKITTARYLTPKGHDINDVGITPDIVVPDVNPSIVGNIETDTQLQRAAAYVQSKIQG
jgi:carboxyl-terminal processing protease